MVVRNADVGGEDRVQRLLNRFPNHVLNYAINDPSCSIEALP